ncbi:hypothetical protein DPMN_192566 [Dreissena polymorpha]|uniref:Uncharacterized protein n=1 Tax=Dreissena polymorpha TaxID=45954 RepID=A0A9D3Y7G9_DREPO|nr:hypothetical protein DPMN_192566 [Dreissena polymorpha]
MSKFHEDNVSSRLFTCFHFIHIKKTTPPPGAHVFPLITTIFKLVRDIYIANVKNVTSRKRPPGGHVCLPIQTIFELNCRIQSYMKKCPAPWRPYIIGINLLTKFHEDWAINVVSRVLTRFYYSHIRKNAPPLGSHVFQANVTIFDLIQDIIKTNLLTKFHEDWTINVASRE